MNDLKVLVMLLKLEVFRFYVHSIRNSIKLSTNYGEKNMLTSLWRDIKHDSSSPPIECEIILIFLPPEAL